LEGNVSFQLSENKGLTAMYFTTKDLAGVFGVSCAKKRLRPGVVEAPMMGLSQRWGLNRKPGSDGRVCVEILYTSHFTQWRGVTMPTF
jgi:hypothetical protein